MRRPRPRTIEEFLRPFTRPEWYAALRSGWPGPDGSSSSTDTIFGVRIGITSPRFEHSLLPANRHDALYFLGRTYRLGGEYREAADAAYRDLCWAACRAELTGWRRVLLPAAYARCWARWAALRGFGWASFTRKQKEAHERAQLAWSGEMSRFVA